MGLQHGHYSLHFQYERVIFGENSRCGYIYLGIRHVVKV